MPCFSILFFANKSINNLFTVATGIESFVAMSPDLQPILFEITESTIFSLIEMTAALIGLSVFLGFKGSYTPAFFAISVTVLVLLIIIILFSFGSNSSQSLVGVKEGTYAVFILLITYGTSVLPLCYIYSMFFNNHSAAQISIMTINFGTGFIAVVTYFILFLGIRTKNIAILLVQFFRIFPTYNIGEGLINVTATFVQNTFLQTEVDYFEWNVAGKFFTFHSALLFFSVLCLYFYFFSVLLLSFFQFLFV